MQTDTPLGSISSAAAAPSVGGPIAVPRKGGFLSQWGPQAWIDMWMSHAMIVKKAWPLVTHTCLPILRLTAGVEQTDRDFEVIKARREIVRNFDSPRERWRKHYGNFVREAEWAILELHKHFSQKQVEQIIIGTSVALAKENSQGFLKMMKGMAGQKPPKQATGPSKPSGVQKLLFDMFNPAGFLTGPAEITEYDPGAGAVTMYIPDCAWHICGAQAALPNPNALPEQGCLMICKGAFEQLFDGEEGGLAMEFEPHLPETSCTVRMSWRVQ